MGKGKNEEKWTEEISGWCVEKYLDQNGVSKLCDLAVDLHKVEDSQLENQAPIDRFIEERIVKTDNRKDKILLAEFGKVYADW